jgi:two-component system NtrC family sensor kinase
LRKSSVNLNQNPIFEVEMPNQESLFNENDRRKLAEATLRNITASTSRVSGEDFFKVLTRDMASALDVFYVLAGRLVVAEDGQEMCQTLAVWAGDHFMTNINYSLDGTPCSNVSSQTMCFHGSGICEAYPLDTLLQDMGAESYIGMSMIDSTGKTLGILVALDKKPIDEDKRLLGLSLLSIFASRCAAELQHQDREAELETLIEVRTAALKQTQAKLIEQDKMAALGSLVAGIAHEVNTPLGVAVTASTSIVEFAAMLTDKLSSDSVPLEELQELAEVISRGASLVNNNLQRANTLIRSFKQLAVDQSDFHINDFNLKSYMQDIFTTHVPVMKKAKVDYQLMIDDDIQMHQASGKLAQILSNLIMNSLNHAFPEGNGGRISVSAKREGSNVRIRFSDNGVGALKEVRKHIFEPFFTTRRGTGGSGLGMQIVYNLVSHLKGEISVSDAAPGLMVEFYLPLSNDQG